MRNIQESFVVIAKYIHASFETHNPFLSIFSENISPRLSCTRSSIPIILFRYKLFQHHHVNRDRVAVGYHKQVTQGDNGPIIYFLWAIQPASYEKKRLPVSPEKIRLRSRVQDFLIGSKKGGSPFPVDGKRSNIKDLLRDDFIWGMASAKSRCQKRSEAGNINLPLLKGCRFNRYTAGIVSPIAGNEYTGRLSVLGRKNMNRHQTGIFATRTLNSFCRSCLFQKPDTIVSRNFFLRPGRKLFGS